MDKSTNSYGEKLISLCKTVPLFICNGRKLGDILGSYTCFKWNGQSVVDYCLASPGIFYKISTFQVDRFLPHISDHCSVSIKLKTCQNLHIQKPTEYEYITKPEKIVWNRATEHKFENIIQSKDSKVFLSNFATNGILPNQDCVDCATDFLSEFLVNSAKLANCPEFRIKFNQNKKGEQPNWKYKRKKHKKVRMPKWHDETCNTLLKKIKQSAFLLKKYPNNSYLRGCIQNESKKYKKLIKSKHKQFLNGLFENLDQLHGANPRGYMELVKSMRDGSFDKNVENDSNYISHEGWWSHFSALLNPTPSPVTF